MSESTDGFEYRFRKIEDAITSLTKRLDHIDEHGSRKVDVIANELAHARSDLADLASEIRDLKQDMRDTRHRLTSAEGALTLMNKTVEANSSKVDGLLRSVIASVLSLGVIVIGSIVTMWLALGGPP